MKHLIRIAIGAALAGALISLLVKRRSGRDMEEPGADAAERERLESIGRGAATGFTVEELTADTPAGRTLNS
jgi:hypothetical protein